MFSPERSGTVTSKPTTIIDVLLIIGSDLSLYCLRKVSFAAALRLGLILPIASWATEVGALSQTKSRQSQEKWKMIRKLSEIMTRSLPFVFCCQFGVDIPFGSIFCSHSCNSLILLLARQMLVLYMVLLRRSNSTSRPDGGDADDVILSIIISLHCS